MPSSSTERVFCGPEGQLPPRGLMLQSIVKGAWSPLGIRHGQALQTVRESIKSNLPAEKHFDLPGHFTENVLVSLLTGALHDTRQCQVIKQKFLGLFNMHYAGIIENLGIMAPYK